MNARRPSPRAYAINSPEAAARVVALALVANGQIKAVETAALAAHRCQERLGMSEAQWNAVVDDLHVDLAGWACSTGASHTSGELLGRVLGEVSDATLRRIVLKLSCAVVYADCHVEANESWVLLAMSENWGLHPDDHALLEPILYGADFQVRLRGVPAGAWDKSAMG